MPITIADNNGSLKITNGTQVRNIMKSQIIEVAVIKTNIIKIDIGQGALHNIFIPFGDVTAPVTANAGALRDAVSAMLNPVVDAGGGTEGLATELKQDSEITQLTSLNAAIDALETLLTTLNEKWFYQVQREDDGGAGVVYKGYSRNAGTEDTEPLWAIERITKIGDVHVHEWADGNKVFDNIWAERETLAYD